MMTVGMASREFNHGRLSIAVVADDTPSERRIPIRALRQRLRNEVAIADLLTNEANKLLFYLHLQKWTKPISAR
jgi:hypothetical protein